MSHSQNPSLSAPARSTSPTDTFLTERQLAERHQRSPKTPRNDRVRGTYIPFVKIGRHIRYRLSDVLAYEEAHHAASTKAK